MVRYYNYTTCTQLGWYNKQYVSQAHQFCAGNATGGQGTCSGDSGGPLVCTQDRLVWIQYGLVSFEQGYHCADPKSPTVYTRLDAFYNWIINVIRDNSF